MRPRKKIKKIIVIALTNVFLCDRILKNEQRRSLKNSDENPEFLVDAFIFLAFLLFLLYLFYFGKDNVK